MTSAFLNTHYLKPLLTYLSEQGLIKNWLKSRIRTSHSRKADENHENSPRSFAFVIVGEHTIHYASAIKALPDAFIIGLLLHEIAHMLIKEDGGDPELGVDEWVLEHVPEAEYKYKNVRYVDFDGKSKTAKNLECVSKEFLEEIGIDS